MEYLQGRIFWNVQLPKSEPDERAAIYEELSRVLAAVHGVDLEQAGLSDYGKPSGYVERQVRRWSEQYRKSETQREPSMEALIEWLPQNLPEHEETTLAHGDFRLDNLIFHPTEPRALGLIDWELSTLGHPIADLAYACMLYDMQFPRVGGLLGVDFEATGIPTEPQFVERYCHHAGRDGVAHWAFFKAFGLFRLAAIAQGVFRRSQQGNASSDEASMYGAAVGLLSGIACRTRRPEGVIQTLLVTIRRMTPRDGDRVGRADTGPHRVPVHAQQGAAREPSGSVSVARRRSVTILPHRAERNRRSRLRSPAAPRRLPRAARRSGNDDRLREDRCVRDGEPELPALLRGPARRARPSTPTSRRRLRFFNQQSNGTNPFLRQQRGRHRGLARGPAPSGATRRRSSGRCATSTRASRW